MKLEQAARQLLSVLESGMIDINAVTALQEALAEQDSGSVCARCGGIVHDPVIEQACPNGCDTSNSRCVDCPDPVVEQAEPVYAFRRKGLDSFCTCDKERYEELADKPWMFEVTTFYAAPVRTVDLTDDEIAEAVGSPLDEVYLADFRAVIAKFKEKNK